MQDLLLVGGGGHCKAVIDVVEQTGTWRIAGVVQSAGSQVTEVSGYPVLGTDDDLSRLHKDIRFALVTVGQIKSPAPRMALYRQLKSIGFGLATVVSPRADVSSRAVIGEGTTVMHFACVGAAAEVGHNTIINTRALVEHDCRVGSHCHISTASVLNGNVIVGDGTFVGSGSVVREGITIGERCVVGMGARVRKHLADQSVFIGGGAS